MATSNTRSQGGWRRHGPGMLALALGGLVAPGMADVKPCSLFSDGAVLQRDVHVPVWGTASDGEKVTVKFQEQEVSTTTKEGRWLVRLQPLKAGGPFTMTITGSNVVEIRDLLVGEVWLCSGQSNMEIPVSQCENPEPVVGSSADARLRLFTVPKAEIPPNHIGPIPELTAKWAVADPATVAGFSGVGYFFGRRLRSELDVPVGLINSSYGGSYAALWMSSRIFKELDSSGTYRNGWLYDSMLRPLQPYALRGVIWYQGESDADNSLRYRKQFPALIRNWREDWQQGDFPFLFVQLTGFNFYQQDVPTEPQEQTTWAELREVQAQTAATVSNTAMVVTTDLGSPENVHPVRKKEIGDRLALTAAGMVYGKGNRYRFPEFKALRIDGDQAVITFAHAEDGLAARGDTVTGFTIAGADRKFYNAHATVAGNGVTVSSPRVPQPVAVRYGWANYPLTNLFDQEGRPAAPFRTDDFPLLKCRKCRSMGGRGIANGICNECGGEAEEYKTP